MKITQLAKQFRFKTHAAVLLSAVCAFCVMFFHPLIYQNFYFNINRFKLLIFLLGSFTALCAYAPLMAMSLNSLKASGENSFKLTLSDIGMAALCVVSIMSCALSDNPLSALTGSDGRYSGLVFTFALASMYVCASRGIYSAKLAAYGLLLSGALCSLLAIINFFGYDPLGFAERLSTINTHRFISTIGNIDFFGAFLCLSLPSAAVLSVRGDKTTAIICLPCAMLGAGAVVACRADATLIALPCACLAAFIAGLRSTKTLARATGVIAAICAGLCLIGAICQMRDGRYLSVKKHACKYIVDNPTVFLVLALAFTALTFIFLMINKREICKKARVWIYSIMALAIFSLACVCVGMFIHYTYYDTQTELTGLARLFRFTDEWGTYRGGVWTRCLKLYAQSDLRVKLVGLGPDCLKLPLKEAYGAEIAAYSGLSFDNAHNEFIQYLLTLGALGVIGYLTFVIGGLSSLFKRARFDFGSAALLAAASTYLLYSFVNVNQPITTPLFFMALSASVSLRINANK